MEERDKQREEEQKERRGGELKPDFPGKKRPISYPIHHEDLIQKTAFLSLFKAYFCQFLLGNQNKTQDNAI